MAHVWTQDHDGGWKVSALDGTRYALPGAAVSAVAARGGRPVAVEPALVRAVDAAGNQRWVLMSEIRSDICVNGQGVPGIRVLADKDEICGRQIGRLYFSTEQLAHVEPFAGCGDASCPRCLRPLEQGDPAVCCPECGVAYHQEDEWPCWTNEPKCAVCRQSTRRDAGFRWTPEEL